MTESTNVNEVEKTEKRIIAPRASLVGEEAFEWLWPGWIAFGAVSVLDGEPDRGKSTVALDLAARLTRGLPMPAAAVGDMGDLADPPGPPAPVGQAPAPMFAPRSVVVASAEDSASRTIRPRLEAAGADLERVRIVEEVVDADGPRAAASFPMICRCWKGSSVKARHGS